MNTGERNRHGRVIYQGARGGRYVMVGTRRQYVSEPAAHAPVAPAPVPVPVPAPAAGTPPGFKRVTVNGSQWIVNKDGRIRKSNGSRQVLRWPDIEKILARVTMAHTGHLNSKHMPFASRTLNVMRPHSPSIQSTNVFVDSANQANRNARIYFKPTSRQLYYRRSNGSFVDASHANVPHGLRLYPGGRARVLAEVLLMTGGNAAPPAAAHRFATLANAYNNFNRQIFARGNLNTSRYTQAEKNSIVDRLENRMKTSMNRYKHDKKRWNAYVKAGRTSTPPTGPNVYGQFINHYKAYYRGWRAMKPLSGRVKSPRIRNVTPNRGTPGKNKNFLSFENLEKPHVVVKRKGVETFHVNPNTLIGMIKSSSGANIKKNNLRDWLREARRNRPKEKLFPHPASKDKFVRPINIRYTRTT